jgi:threonine/homoserine/homoserine lactone efflux protein
VTSPLVAFIPAAALLVITPGPDMALITKNALTRGKRAALMTAFGIESGLLVWTGASVLGIVAVLRSSTVAFTILKFVGAAYLVYLGVTAFLSLRAAAKSSGPAPAPVKALSGSPFRQGLLSNVFNPKIVVFFTSFIPQFVTPGPAAVAQSVGYAAIFMVMGMVWLVSYALFAANISTFLRKRRVNQAMTVATGCVLTGFGVALAFSS